MQGTVGYPIAATRFFLVLASLVGILALGASPARAAGAPQISASWVTNVNADSATLDASIDPNGLTTKFRFEYISDVDFQKNLSAGHNGFTGAAPASGDIGIGTEQANHPWSQKPGGLTSVTTYHYRPVATNSAGVTLGPEHAFTTQAATNAPYVADDRGWEMVSPVDKGGGTIPGPGGSFGGVFQAAAAGGALTYSSVTAFGTNPQGAPVASQYLARRGGAGWATENITTPLLSGSYGDRPDGAPYQLFSGDLARGLLLNGRRCRGSGGKCPVANLPLPGSGAPPGYENYYLRDNATASFGALLRQADVAGFAPGPAQFELGLAGASPDLAHVALSTCAALTANATEVPAAGGCDPAAQNLYLWGGGGLSLLNLQPGAPKGTPGAALAAQGSAISSDGARVYWTVAGKLYLREGAQTKLVDEGGIFETASANGSVAFFTKVDSATKHLYRYVAATGVATDLTPGGEVAGVLGASADGSRVYYGSAAGLQLWDAGSTIEVAPGATAAAPVNYPPTTGAARVSADGSHLAFLSSAELTGYDNAGFTEVYLYGPPVGGGPPTLTCVSCNPTGEKSEGASSIPGATANGTTSTAIHTYKPRALSANGFRVFFDSYDDLVSQDAHDGKGDVYEWEAGGSGSCQHSGGCVSLLSSGRSPEASSFVDASLDGADAFFLTEASLVPGDPGSYDLYDAREGGGFPVPPTPIPCDGDACQSLPEAPEDPTPGTLVPNGGNPPLRFAKQHRKAHHGKKGHRHGKRHQRHRGRR